MIDWEKLAKELVGTYRELESLENELGVEREIISDKLDEAGEVGISMCNDCGYWFSNEDLNEDYFCSECAYILMMENGGENA